MTACIEASIPFRPKTGDNEPMERLYKRIQSTNQECSIGLTDAELLQTVRTAATFSNYDLGSFRQTEVDVFLDNTWKLLPEWKPVLVSGNCKLQDIDDAFLLLHGRYQSMNVQLIFQQFRGFPAPADLTSYRQRASENLNVVWQYISVRLLQVHVILGLLRMVMGDVEDVIATIITTGSPSAFLRLLNDSVDQKLTERPMNPPEGWNDQVHRFLTQGRRRSFEWDPAVSPLSALLYTQLGGVPAVALANRVAKGGHTLRLLPFSVLKYLVTILSELQPQLATQWQGVAKKLGVGV